MSTLDLLLKKGADEAPANTTDIALPTSKTALAKLKVDELTALAAKLEVDITDLAKPAIVAKLADTLFSEDGTVEQAMTAQEAEPEVKTKVKNVAAATADYSNDPLAKLAKDIEGLTSQKEVEARIADTFKQEVLNEFAIGGLFTKLNEIGDFGEFKNFADYVEPTFGMKYRKARYLMAIYSVLIDLQIPFAEVQHVGWTKLKELVPVLTSDNWKGWVEKAVLMNTDTLIAEVKSAVAGGTNDEASTEDAQPAKTIVSKTLKLHEDQLETFNDAVAKAKQAIGTDSDTVAIDAILMEYLGNAPATTAKTKTVEVEKPVLDPNAFWSALAAQYKDDPKSAMVAALGESNFDELFPTVELNIGFLGDDE